MSETNGLEIIEADLLFDELTMVEMKPIPRLHLDPSEVTVRRDQNFKIKLEMTGVLPPGARLPDDDGPPLGTVSDAANTEGTSRYGATSVQLKGVIPGGHTIDGAGKFTAFGSASRVFEVYQDDVQTKSSIMYLLGFPSGMPSRGTSRKASGQIILERDDVPEIGDSRVIKKPLTGSASRQEHSRDCILISSKYGNVLLSKGASNELSKKFKPSYLHFISGTGVTDENARRSFLEAVNFCIGKRLIEIGHTELDADHRLIRRSSRTPYTLNLHAEAASVDLPPSTILEGYGFINERAISTIVDLFLDSRERLKLSDVMWNIWTARMMPLGLELVAYAAALEALINAWFEHNENPDRSCYVSRAEFQAMTSAPLGQIKESAPKNPDWEKICHNLSNANRLAIADKYRRFFDELGLKTGAVEKEVIRSRNKYAHGGIVDDSEAKRLVVIARAYEALLNRSLLRAIGFDGKYRDYSTLNFPERPLSEPMGGPNNDGKI